MGVIQHNLWSVLCFFTSKEVFFHKEYFLVAYKKGGRDIKGVKKDKLAARARSGQIFGFDLRAAWHGS